MDRTWLVRGTAAAVFAVLVGSWGVGVAGLRDSDSPSVERPPASPSPESSVAPEDEGAEAGEKVKPPRAPKTHRPRDKATAPSPDSDEPANDSPTTRAPESPEPTPDSPDSTADSEEPSDSPPPPGPTGTPDQPSDDCTELLGVLDCVLNPITAQP